MPWDLERLTADELDQYVRQLADYQKAQAKADKTPRKR
jgi:hypothetical protein